MNEFSIPISFKPLGYIILARTGGFVDLPHKFKVFFERSSETNRLDKRAHHSCLLPDL